MRKLLINDSELAKYKSKNLNHDEDIIVNYLAALKEQQLGSWKLFSQNHSQLSNVETKEYDFTGTKILVQHNPARITSTSAKVDSQSIKNRACFCALTIYHKNKEACYLLINISPFVIPSQFLIITSRYQTCHIHHN